MRLVFFVLLCGSFLANSAFAERKYGMAGCGLGALIFEKKAAPIAFTTNAIYSNQAFGISSGTSNCQLDSETQAKEAQQRFISDNFVALSKEMAKGDGMYLRSFAATFGCSDAVYPNFASQMQQSYSQIFAAPGAMAALQEVQKTIGSDSMLSAACNQNFQG